MKEFLSKNKVEKKKKGKDKSEKKKKDKDKEKSTPKTKEKVSEITTEAGPTQESKMSSGA